MSDHPEAITPCIARKRYIPDELIVLNKDRIYEFTPTRVLTAWEAIRPRADIAGGLSVYYPERGFKISKIYNSSWQLVHWYCDIIRFHFPVCFFQQPPSSPASRPLPASGDTLPFQPSSPSSSPVYYEDLLLDIVINPTGQVQVLDADELADALEQGLIDSDTVCLALRQLNDLLTCIASGDFLRLQQPVLDLEQSILSGQARPLTAIPSPH